MAAPVNADRRLAAAMDGARLRWQPSPLAGVQRRLLERDGGEVALATSLVRYAPGSRFDAHGHALGEEFMVLRGVFSDEHGDYPAGTYVRNPPGTAHRPFSRGGCIIFVKLRQMQADDRQHRIVRPRQRGWAPTGTGWHEALLHASGDESVRLARLPAGCSLPARPTPGGEELFVLQGHVRLTGAMGSAQASQQMRQEQMAPLARWGWLRHPGEEQPALHAPEGALLWIKRGHLPRSQP